MCVWSGIPTHAAEMTASNNGTGSDNNSAKEDRKLRKPLIEKRRRERINCSMQQLKGIMVNAYSLDQSKLEKADVLEVTVQHMESLQNSHAAGSPATNRAAGCESPQRYSSGYIHCVHEVHNLLLSCPGMDKGLGAGLLHHLLKTLPKVSADRPPCHRHFDCESPPGSPPSPALRTPIGPRRRLMLTALPPGAEERERPMPVSSLAPPPVAPLFASPGGPSMWRPW